MPTFILTKSMTRPLTSDEQVELVHWWRDNGEVSLDDVIKHFEAKWSMPVTKTAVTRAMLTVVLTDNEDDEDDDDPHSNGGHCDHAPCSHERLFRLYYTDDSGERHTLGEDYYVSADAARSGLMADYWDDRLDAASCSPIVEAVYNEDDGEDFDDPDGEQGPPDSFPDPASSEP